MAGRLYLPARFGKTEQPDRISGEWNTHLFVGGQRLGCSDPVPPPARGTGIVTCWHCRHPRGGSLTYSCIAFNNASRASK
jgi:hypothetical protein